jgi:WD40 repeat protein
MNTRQAIQPTNTPAVLSISFSPTRKRFAAGLSDGLRVFRSDNCLTTYTPPGLQLPGPTYGPSKRNPEPKTSLPQELEGGIALVEVLDDRYLAFVSGGRLRNGRESVVVFWDCLLERETARLDFSEPIRGLKVSGKSMVVVLLDRSVILSYQKLKRDSGVRLRVDEDAPEAEDDDDEELKGPNKVHALHHTAVNPYALACLRDDVLVLPAQSVGQVALIPLPSGSKRVLRAHNSTLRCVGLSPSGHLLATASEQGTLIRVFDTKTLDQVAEFRRGVEKAVIFGLAFSDGGRWLACTSDKGTIHIFDLRPPTLSDEFAMPTRPASSGGKAAAQHRKSQSNPTHRLSLNTTDGKANAPASLLSGRSSPSTATKTTQTQTPTQIGSIQEYYGLLPPPPPVHTQPPLATTLNAFKQSSWAPKVFKDVRSVAHAPFFLGADDEGPYWQGGKGHSWTTDPSGTRRRVRNPVPPLPAEPSGRAPKGIVAFASKDDKVDGRDDEEGAVVYVLGGGLGVEARWECFDLVPTDVGGWVSVRRGFRRILGRQFVD